VRDGKRDHVHCGDGRDAVRADRRDHCSAANARGHRLCRSTIRQAALSKPLPVEMIRRSEVEPDHDLRASFLTVSVTESLALLNCP
jgi:hypothetical protein